MFYVPQNKRKFACILITLLRTLPLLTQSDITPTQIPPTLHRTSVNNALSESTRERGGGGAEGGVAAEKFGGRV